MSTVMKKNFADLIFEDRNRDFGAYFLRRVYEKHIFTAVVASVLGFVSVLAGPVLYKKFFAEKEVVKEHHVVEVVLEDIPSIAPPEDLPPPPPEIKIEAPKVSKVKFLPPKVTPDEEIKVEEVPPTTEELEESNPGDETQEGTTSLNELEDVDVEEQQIVETKPEDNKIYTWVEQSASFEGGKPKLQKFLMNNLKYPDEALKAQKSDFVVLKFVISKDGSITNIRVVKSAGYGMDEEAVRVIQAMPRWTPARQNGSPVRQEKSIKIPFVLK